MSYESLDIDVAHTWARSSLQGSSALSQFLAPWIEDTTSAWAIVPEGAWPAHDDFASSRDVPTKTADDVLATLLERLDGEGAVRWVIVESDLQSPGDPHVGVEAVVIGDRIAYVDTATAAAKASLHRRRATGYPLNAWWLRPSAHLTRDRLVELLHDERFDEIAALVACFCCAAYDAETYMLLTDDPAVAHELRGA